MNGITIKDIVGDESIEAVGGLCVELENIFNKIKKDKNSSASLLAASTLFLSFYQINLENYKLTNKNFTEKTKMKLPSEAKEITLCLEKICNFSERLNKALLDCFVDMQTITDSVLSKEENKKIN